MPLTNISVINKLLSVLPEHTLTLLQVFSCNFNSVILNFFFDLTSSQCKIVQDSLNWIPYSTLSPEVRLSKGPETFRVQNLLNNDTVPRLEKLSKTRPLDSGFQRLEPDSNR